MANEEHLKILKQGVEALNKRRKANFYMLDLSGANLLDADLNDANLNGAYLVGANLCRADLLDADLYGADLGHCRCP